MTSGDDALAMLPVMTEGNEIKEGTRVNSRDYGNGTVVAVMGNQIQIYWDHELSGTSQHLLSHDRSYVQSLERL